MKTGTHIKYMLYAAAGIFAILALAGVPLSTALTYGIFLACPLMMVWMMAAMGGHGHGDGPGPGASEETVRDADRAPVDRSR